MNFQIHVKNGVISGHTPVIELIEGLNFYLAEQDMWGCQVAEKVGYYRKDPLHWESKNGKKFRFQPATDDLIIEFHAAVIKYATKLQQWVDENRPEVVADGWYQVTKRCHRRTESLDETIISRCDI